MIGTLAAGLAASSLATAAAAPGSNALGAGAIMQKVSISDVSAMMGELGLASSVMPLPTGGKALIVTTEGGAKLGFSFHGCDDQANALGCSNTIVTAGYPGAGVTLDALNDFNGVAVVTVAVKAPEINLVVFGRNIVVLGGHARELFKGTVFLFLQDIQNFVDSGKAGVDSVSLHENAAAPLVSLGAGKKDYSLETMTAIANVKGVSFAIRGAAPY